MKRKHTSIDWTFDQLPQNPPDTCLRGGWLKAARGVWILLSLFLLGVAIASLPASFAALHQLCTAGAAACNGQGLLTANQVQALHRLGLELSTYAWFRIVTTSLGALFLFVMGGILFWRRSDDWMVLLVALLFASLGATNATNVLAFGASLESMLAQSVFLIESVAMLLTLALFPNGRFVPGFTRWLVLLYPAYVVFYLVVLNQLHLPGWMLFNNPVNTVLWFGSWGLLTLAQLYRYFLVSTPIERQQTKWVAFMFLVVLVVGVVGYVTTPTLLSLFHNGFLYLLTMNLAPFLGLFIPLSIGIAILRYRLWEIDLIINRTLSYGMLTASVIGIYVLVVAVLGAVLQAQGNLLISLLATGLVAVLFQPLRTALQRGVNRMLFGERDEPYQVIARLGQHLEATLAPEEVLPAIVETVARSLKLPYAAISLKQDNAFIIATSYGVPRDPALHLPLTYHADTIGELILAPRAGSESFTRNERQLLQELARQAGIALQGVLLTADLERSRQRIVAAREEARRRLGNDLHDGLGHLLAGVLRKVERTTSLLERDPLAAQQALIEIKQQTRSAIETIRHLAHTLHPPELELLGVSQALRERIGQYDGPNRDELQVTIDAPATLPGLPIAVEAAVYYIALEAVSNVYRHAHARHCFLRLRLIQSNGEEHPIPGMWTTALVELDICDDGCGLPKECREHPGLGLASMRERAAELGGTCRIEQAAQRGTRVFVRLPCMHISETGGK